MLGYLVAEGQGAADRLLFSVAEHLLADGWFLAGAVQANSEGQPMSRCDMDLHVLAADRVVRISQNLGMHSTGCRLDPVSLETAVGLAETALSKSPHLCVVNKFGKTEVDGKGFRSVIAEAIARDIPVLTSVSRGNLGAFNFFVDGFGEEIPADFDSVLKWCHAQKKL